MTACEIIQETYDYYTKNPNNRRALDVKGGCRYNLEVTSDYRNDKHCAVGRCLRLKYQRQRESLTSNTDGVETLIDDNAPGEDDYNNGVFTIDDMLKKKYRGHPEGLWDALQNFHDNGVFWSTKENSITKDGQGKYEILMRNYKIGGIEYDGAEK
tara:strand:+ start:1525 stop:1989 length:465 start_codon:yes stop_codon:yes gene_type:complete